MRQVSIPLPVWYSHKCHARRSFGAIEDLWERSKRTEIRYVSKASRNHARIIKWYVNLWRNLRASSSSFPTSLNCSNILQLCILNETQFIIFFVRYFIIYNVSGKCIWKCNSRYINCIKWRIWIIMTRCHHSWHYFR